MEGGELFQRIQDRQDEGPFTERGKWQTLNYCLAHFAFKLHSMYQRFNYLLRFFVFFPVSFSLYLCGQHENTCRSCSNNAWNMRSREISTRFKYCTSWLEARKFIVHITWYQWRAQINRFRLCQRDIHKGYIANTMLHTILCCTRGARTGKIRQELWYLVAWCHHVYFVGIDKLKWVEWLLTPGFPIFAS